MGHLVFEAMSAEEALPIFEREDVDVLLTDHGLPGMSGADLAVACKLERQDLGIIFASGAVEVPKVKGYHLIADAVVLGKPYDEPALEAAIEQVRTRASLQATSNGVSS